MNFLRSTARALFGRAKGDQRNNNSFDELQRSLWVNKADRDSSRVVLLSLYQYPASIVANAHAGNLLANYFGARLAYYSLDEHPLTTVECRYQAFGANKELSYYDRERFRQRATKEAGALFSRIHTKADLLALCFSGIFIGDLVYDSYLRFFSKATVNLEDPRLFEILVQALCNIFAFEEYYEKNEVCAAIIDHFYYITGGVIARLAHKRSIPLFLYGFTQPFYFLRAPLITAHDGSQVPGRFDSENFPALLGRFSSEERARLREIGRSKLTETLNGGGEHLIYGHISPFTKPAGEPVLCNTGRPRILVMLQEFCDAPNCLGSLLFPDFHEWIFYLLDRASRTDFDWIIKPHACLQTRDRSGMNEENFRVVEKIRHRYPRFQILDPSVSNRQILEEGIASMFTVRGSGAYELAYLGVPVVTAGKSFYSAYQFAHRAQSLAQFDDLIARADRLECPANKSEIEEFYYVYREFLKDTFHTGVSLFPEAIASLSCYEELIGSEELFTLYADSWTPEFQAATDAAISLAIQRELSPN